jgi:hypothetical protein
MHSAGALRDNNVPELRNVYSGCGKLSGHFGEHLAVLVIELGDRRLTQARALPMVMQAVALEANGFVRPIKRKVADFSQKIIGSEKPLGPAACWQCVLLFKEKVLGRRSDR